MKGLQRTIAVVLLCMTVCCMLVTVSAETQEELTAESVKRFVDGFMQENMDKYHVPASGVAVVSGDDVLFTGAYGYESIENDIPADGDTSMFSIGSMSKIFVYTAMMQLYEQGLLDFDAPVEQYIDFEIDTSFDDPILISDLYNHTAGFEEKLYLLKARSYEEIQSLEDWLQTCKTKQVRVPGRYTAYSNYGITLLALIVENISGMPYYDYIQANILDPLGMDSTLTDQKPVAHIVSGYRYNPADGTYMLQPDEFWNVGPAGAMKTTPADAAKFLIAQLNNGKYDGNSIMEPGTMQLMHTATFTYEDSFNGMAHGMIEGSYNGYQYVSHGGTTSYQFTAFNVYEDLNLGIYITSGCDGGSILNALFCKEFIDHFYDSNLEEAAYIDGVDLRPFQGSYHMARSNYTTIEKILRWANSIELKVEGDRLLSSTGQVYRAIGPMMVVDETGNEKIWFEQDENGKITGFASSAKPITFFEKDSSLTQSGNLFILGAALGAAFVLSLLIRLAAGIVRKIRKNTWSLREKRIRRYLNFHAILVLLAVLGVALIYFTLDGVMLMIGNVFSIRVTLTLTTLVLPSTLIGIYQVVRMWKHRCFGAAVRWHETLMMALSVLLVAWMFFWNMIGWQL